MRRLWGNRRCCDANISRSGDLPKVPVEGRMRMRALPLSDRAAIATLLFGDGVFAEFAEVLRILEVFERIALEFKAHVIFADSAAIGDGDFHLFARTKRFLAENIVFPVIHAYRRRVKGVENGARSVLQREDEVFRLRRTGNRHRRREKCSHYPFRFHDIPLCPLFWQGNAYSLTGGLQCKLWSLVKRRSCDYWAVFAAIVLFDISRKYYKYLFYKYLFHSL
ncbi:hypothetical protein AGR13a_Cc200004 [Agrobacterium genomosp. 13 str. CFBP 6927]|uniref:Uncharacterized protein n=1 Tax=Agrobacterium genomosp. 13 str. CFBP 6927 TaxID=1183428 RepID=A0ABM9VD69_9HYPH|nr:hypothetical protein AGR13a_Cc200004 [Agrobacterium genomosp. 13 str. CFBP 6927]